MIELLGQFFQLFFDLLPRPLMVGPTERAVRVLFGRRIKIWEPGWYVHWPVICEVEVYSVNSQLVETATLSVGTSDGECLQVRIAVEFLVSDPEKFYLESQDGQLHVEMIAGSSMISLLSANDLAHIQLIGAFALCRKVRNRIRETLQSRGVDIKTVRPVMWSTAFPIFLSQAERLAE